MNFLEWLGFNKLMKDTEPSNIVKFPEVKTVPQVKPPEPKEKPANTFYRLGLTDNNRVSFQMGYSEITMNREGVDNLIKQLEVFKNQLPEDYVEEETDSNDSSPAKN